MSRLKVSAIYFNKINRIQIQIQIQICIYILHFKKTNHQYSKVHSRPNDGKAYIAKISQNTTIQLAIRPIDTFQYQSKHILACVQCKHVPLLIRPIGTCTNHLFLPYMHVYTTSFLSTIIFSHIPTSWCFILYILDTTNIFMPSVIICNLDTTLVQK